LDALAPGQISYLLFPLAPSNEEIAMFKSIVAVVVLLGSTSLVMADAKDDVQAAAAKLNDSPNYSWTSSMESGQFSSSTSGKTQKDGLTWVSLTFGDTTTEALIKGSKAAIKTDDGWKTADEVVQEQQQGGGPNPMIFVARMVQNFRTPGAQAVESVGQIPDLQKTDDGYSGNLSDEAAKQMMTFRRRNASATTQPSPVKNAKASVKFWVTDGVLSKLQYQVSGTVTFNDQDRDVQRTTTVEIKDVGSTKIDVPPEAQAKLQ
jgi:hypothetical protein